MKSNKELWKNKKCVCVCVCERERERESVCVCESERKRAVVDLERGCINHRCQFESMAMIMLLLLDFFQCCIS